MNLTTAPAAADSSSAPASPAAGDATVGAAKGPVEPTSADETFLGWTAGDRWFFTVLAAVLLVALSVLAVRKSGWGISPIPVERPENRKYEFQLDVNTATWVEWMQLEGIGEALGRKIVADREANGPFRSVDDVGRVKGVGEAKLAAMRPWLTYADETAVDRRGSIPTEPPAADDPPGPEK